MFHNFSHLKKSILNFERINNTRDVALRREYNTILRGGGRKKQRGIHSTNEPKEFMFECKEKNPVPSQWLP